jgi:hypothetical protein
MKTVRRFAGARGFVALQVRPLRGLQGGHWRTALLLLLATLSMAHVGSPDTFFAGMAGPYHVRVSVRLPGVIPGRAQVAVHVAEATSPADYRVAVRAGQWNVGLKGAPPPENAAPVPGDPTLFAAELWFMTPTSYLLAVDVTGPSGPGTVSVPVVALATAERTMAPWLGGVLAALGLFLTAGLVTIVGTAVRESGLPPGQEPDARRRQRGRIGIGVTAIVIGLLLWGGNLWWAAEAGSYSEFVLYRPFKTESSVSRQGDRQLLTLGIRDSRWTGTPNPLSRFNALLPDHGKLMHLFLVRESDLEGFAHLHPVARSTQALDFDTDLPSLPAGRYRVYGDLVHESGYPQTLVSHAEIAESTSGSTRDPDDSWFSGRAASDGAAPAVDLADGSRLTWRRGDAPLVAGVERVLAFDVRDAGGAIVSVEPYMGMAAHAAVASGDGAVFAHLHPSGSISMAAQEKLSGVTADAHAGHPTALEGSVAIPYAFPRPGAYRVWVQIKRGGQVMTAAYDATVGTPP